MSEQCKLVLGFKELTTALESGKYGTDNDIDVDAILDDIEELLTEA